MKLTRRVRLRLWLQSGAFTLLLIAAALLGAIVARQHSVDRDVTQNARSTLSDTSVQTLKQLQGPVTVTAYATPQDPQLGDLRAMIQNFFARYQKVKPDLELKFVDPREQPKLTREAGVRVNGEMVVAYGKRSEHLSTLNEQEVTNMLMRLARSTEKLVLALDGHGERRLNGPANHDLGDFGRQLQSHGFQINSANLAIAQEVPDNAAVLVIASPQVDLLPAEVDKIKRYVARGGNLLWLIDAEPLRGLQPLAEQLGLLLTPGVVVDPAAAALKAEATMALATAYANHPITRAFHLNTVFPFARQIATQPGGEWRNTPLIEVAQRGWVETGPLDRPVSFDKGRDTPGPVTIAVALEREVRDRSQRAVVVGSGNFLANTFLGNGGNLALGMNIVNWLAGDDAFVAIAPHTTVDVQLDLGRGSLLAIAIGFLFALPLALFAAGGYLWWRRRRL